MVAILSMPQCVMLAVWTDHRTQIVNILLVRLTSEWLSAK